MKLKARSYEIINKISKLCAKLANKSRKSTEKLDFSFTTYYSDNRSLIKKYCVIILWS